MITQERLIEKINALPPRKLSEVEDFVDFITAKSSSPERDVLIAQFAAEFGGTEFDLDENLDAAGRRRMHGNKADNPPAFINIC